MPSGFKAYSYDRLDDAKAALARVRLVPNTDRLSATRVKRKVEGKTITTTKIVDPDGVAAAVQIAVRGF